MRHAAPDVIQLPRPDHASGSASAGIRPQHVARLGAADATPEGWGRLVTTVDVIEPMGWEAYVHATLGADAPFVAQLEAHEIRDLEPGAALHLGVEPRHIHWFGEDGARIEP